MNKKMAIITYKKWDVNIILRIKRKNSSFETHCHSTMKTTSPLEIAHQDNSNITAKGCMTTWKKVTHAIRATTQKTSQTKYHEGNYER
jgi:hypothetical protein